MKLDNLQSAQTGKSAEKWRFFYVFLIKAIKAAAIFILRKGTKKAIELVVIRAKYYLYPY